MFLDVAAVIASPRLAGKAGCPSGPVGCHGGAIPGLDALRWAAPSDILVLSGISQQSPIRRLLSAKCHSERTVIWFGDGEDNRRRGGRERTVAGLVGPWREIIAPLRPCSDRLPAHPCAGARPRMSRQ